MSKIFSRFFDKLQFTNYRVLSQTLTRLKMPTAIVVLPPGAEEMEFVGSVDVLRRAGVSLSLRQGIECFDRIFPIIIYADNNNRRRTRGYRCSEMFSRCQHRSGCSFGFSRQRFIRCYCE